MIKDLAVSKKAMGSLVEVGERDPAMAYLSKSKRACILQ